MNDFLAVIAGGGGTLDCRVDGPDGPPFGDCEEDGPFFAFPNEIHGSFSFIGGGAGNRIDSFMNVICGGHANQIRGLSGVSGILGGVLNTLPNAGACTIVGGLNNLIAGEGHSTSSSIGGGDYNIICYGNSSLIAGGYLNFMDSQFGVIGGGYQNSVEAGALYSTIPGGFHNTVRAQAFAAGSFAEVNHHGTFVWADSNYGNDPDCSFHTFPSQTNNEFAVRATGGVRFVSVIGTNGTPTSGVTLAPGGGSWSMLSDRNAKENFTVADGREILEKVAALPLATWNYKAQGKSIRHIGPMAQDFKAAFGVGENERTITTADADGVALAAIQGLNQKLEEQLKAKEARIEALQRQMDQLEKLLKLRLHAESKD